MRANGETFGADLVISNADAIETYRNLLESKNFKTASRRAAVSFFCSERAENLTNWRITIFSFPTITRRNSTRSSSRKFPRRTRLFTFARPRAPTTRNHPPDTKIFSFWSMRLTRAKRRTGKGKSKITVNWLSKSWKVSVWKV